MTQFSIIVGYRNRDLGRVKHSLDSLLAQTLKDFELIFIDYGSDLPLASEVRDLVKKYSFTRYFFNDTRGCFWNRSHALNCGIEKAVGRISVLWDIDLIVEPDFLEKMSQVILDKEFTTHRCYYLPENTSLSQLDAPDFKRNLQHAYVGLCGVQTEKLREINGYDEFFQVWGAEDDDLYDRLQKTGLTKRIINADEIPVYHQWHPTQSLVLPDMWYLTMVEKLFNPERNMILPNGTFFKTGGRPALMAVQNRAHKNGLELTLDLENKTLLYNSLIREFETVVPGDQLYIDFYYPQMEPHPKAMRVMKRFNLMMTRMGRNIRLINQKQEVDKQLKDNIYGFLKYFLGRQRDRLLDYYLDWREDGFFLLLIRA